VSFYTLAFGVVIGRIVENIAYYMLDITEGKGKGGNVAIYSDVLSTFMNSTIGFN